MSFLCLFACSDCEVFPKNHAAPFSKVLTFYRKEPFTLDAYYSAPKELPYPDPSLGKYSIRTLLFNLSANLELLLSTLLYMLTWCISHALVIQRKGSIILICDLDHLSRAFVFYLGHLTTGIVTLLYNGKIHICFLLNLNNFFLKYTPKKHQQLLGHSKLSCF